jgi:hypothetical protein
MGVRVRGFDRGLVVKEGLVVRSVKGETIAPSRTVNGDEWRRRSSSAESSSLFRAMVLLDGIIEVSPDWWMMVMMVMY